MNIYPALKARLGNWEYYIVKMSARELSDQVYFAHEVYENYSLGDAIQRILKENRVSKDLVEYLTRQENRFFSSLVIAAINGNPEFYPMQLENHNKNKIFLNDKRFNDSFGALVFDGAQKYYALDGQHRLAAIKKVVDPCDAASKEAPKGFRDEEFSVIVVVPAMEDDDETFLQKYRRLFSNLNRYAKPTDNATNIIMDEDDVFAVITRRLIAEHGFFMKGNGELVVDTSAGKNIKFNSKFFTNIETLYQVNIELLSSEKRREKGWSDGSRLVKSIEDYKRFRPEEGVVETLYKELESLWDGIIDVLPVLKQDPSRHRIHDSDSYKTKGIYKNDTLLFWPIGQEILARIVRKCVDLKFHKKIHVSQSDVKSAIAGLSDIEWRLHYPPWRYFLLTYKVLGRKNWNIRSEERGKVSKISQKIIEWQLGIQHLSENELKELKTEWRTRLNPQPRQPTVSKYWHYVQETKNNVGKKVAGV